MYSVQLMEAISTYNILAAFAEVDDDGDDKDRFVKRENMLYVWHLHSKSGDSYYGGGDGAVVACKKKCGVRPRSKNICAPMSNRKSKYTKKKQKKKKGRKSMSCNTLKTYNVG